MNLIVAVDRNFGIGKDNKLPWRLRADMAYFKKITMDKTVVMGRKTFESLPGGRPLPGRRNIVLTTDLDYQKEGIVVCHSPEQVFLEVAKDLADDVFIIGGAKVYRTFLPFCRRAYVTKIDAVYDTDTSMVNLDNDPAWELEHQSEEQSENGVTFRFLVYINRKAKEFSAKER